MSIDEPSMAPRGGDPQTVAGEKWIRGMVDGKVVVDSRDYLFVWENPYWPWWFFRPADIRGELVAPRAAVEGRELPVGAVAHDLVVGDRTFAGVARSYPNHPTLEGWVALDFESVDHWFEEDVEVFVHPRSPYTRVDALASSRHVVVSLHGIELANSRKPTVLFETGISARFYLPMTDVNLARLSENDRQSSCPYKGDANFFDADLDGETVPHIAWTYRRPLPEAAPVAGMISFYNEIVDIDVDSVRQTRPVSHFA